MNDLQQSDKDGGGMNVTTNDGCMPEGDTSTIPRGLRRTEEEWKAKRDAKIARQQQSMATGVEDSTKEEKTITATSSSAASSSSFARGLPRNEHEWKANHNASQEQPTEAVKDGSENTTAAAGVQRSRLGFFPPLSGLDKTRYQKQRRGAVSAPADRPTDGTTEETKDKEGDIDDCYLNLQPSMESTEQAREPDLVAMAEEDEMVPAPLALERTSTRRQPQQPGAVNVVGIGSEAVEIASVDGSDDHGGQPLSTHDYEAGLVEAREVSQTFSSSLLHADEVDTNAELEKREGREKSERLFRCVGMAVLCLAVMALAITLGLVLGRKEDDPALAPSFTPSSPPSEVPSMAPTGSLDLLLDDLPTSTLENLNNITTPQWKAFDWLSRHPKMSELEEWRKVQLFALATFFYAFEGPKWKEVIRKRWLNYEVDECFWWSAEFGEFQGEDGYEEDAHPIGVEICNDQGEFQNLYVDQLEIFGGAPVIPPEISLLKSLSVLRLSSTNTSTSFDTLLPTDIYQMTQLEFLTFFESGLSGTIPSELGMMTGLTLFLIVHNTFTGTIPSQIGLLSNLGWLSFGMNTLTGPIPSQVGLLSNMLELIPALNLLTGSIPSQIGLCSNAYWLFFFNNWLSGELPSEIGKLSNLTKLAMDYNQISGSIPNEIAQINTLAEVWLNNNLLTGTIPNEFENLALNGTLSVFDVRNNDLSGTIPNGLCLLGPCNYTTGICYPGLGFDCNSSKLCGCDWCPCQHEDMFSTYNGSAITTNSSQFPTDFFNNKSNNTRN